MAENAEHKCSICGAAYRARQFCIESEKVCPRCKSIATEHHDSCGWR